MRELLRHEIDVPKIDPGYRKEVTHIELTRPFPSQGSQFPSLATLWLLTPGLGGAGRYAIDGQTIGATSQKAAVGCRGLRKEAERRFSAE